MRQTLWLALSLAPVLAGTAPSTPVNAAEGVRAVMVPRGVIYPGDVISAESLVARNLTRDTESPAVFGENPKDLIGKVARRTLLRGEFIPSSAVREQELIVQGRRYKLSYISESISIVGVGIPLQSGAAGDIVSVRNPDSGIVIKARVRADQTLAVEDQ
ncbi:flagella basal body P-ring formation protein FlgA [Hyphomicrobium methylovorum]|nr:flagella basal body P-ring formation protein FlgA [Hyphomicrobium methylovorum]